MMVSKNCTEKETRKCALRPFSYVRPLLAPCPCASASWTRHRCLSCLSHLNRHVGSTSDNRTRVRHPLHLPSDLSQCSFLAQPDEKQSERKCRSSDITLKHPLCKKRGARSRLKSEQQLRWVEPCFDGRVVCGSGSGAHHFVVAKRPIFFFFFFLAELCQRVAHKAARSHLFLFALAFIKDDM